MKKQKVFVLVQHGNDNQDYSSVDVLPESSTPRPQQKREWMRKRQRS